MLQENFAPDGGGSLAGEVGSRLGYRVVEAELGRVRLLEEDPALARPGGPASWGPRLGRLTGRRALALESVLARSRRPSRRPATAGSWGIALLSRLPLRRVEVVDLVPLRRDPTRRRAILAELESGLLVAGTHLAHLEDGSPRQMRQLARLLAGSGPRCLTGDMNSWSLPLLALLPGWRKAVRGPTWPAPHPHSQIDHLLVAGGVVAARGEVSRPLGSDHRAVRAELRTG